MTKPRVLISDKMDPQAAPIFRARGAQHRTGAGSDFSRRYGLTRLVWAEQATTIEECIAHEKRLKRWRREWKLALIEAQTPQWFDRYDQLI